jgi:hypothetical protein
MTKVTFYDIPVELLIKICDFCDDKQIMTLSKVSKIWYDVTKQIRDNITDYVKSYSDCGTNEVHKNNIIRHYIANNNVNYLHTLLELGCIHPYRKLYTHEKNIDTYITILDYAIFGNKKEMIELFSEFCDINKPNEELVTPLMNCVKGIYGIISMDILKYILSLGVEPNIEDRNGYIAMDYISHISSSSIRFEIIKILRYYGSREGLTISQYSDSDSYFSQDSE